MNTNVINQQASQIVVQDYFNLVRAIASKIKRRLPVHVDVEDLVQTGMLGLLEASNRYDATRATDFHTYAYARIQGAILDELRSHMLLPKLSGPDVLRALKSDPATAGIPVIILTGLSRKNEERLKADGAAAFVEKESLSRDSGPLLRVLERVVRESRADLEDAARGKGEVTFWAAAGALETSNANAARSSLRPVSP